MKDLSFAKTVLVVARYEVFDKQVRLIGSRAHSFKRVFSRGTLIADGVRYIHVSRPEYMYGFSGVEVEFWGPPVANEAAFREQIRARPHAFNTIGSTAKLPQKLPQADRPNDVE